MNIVIKDLSLVWTPIDYDRSNWACITVCLLECPYCNETLTSRVGVSCEYGINRWCRTRYWRQWNQAIIWGKVGIADVFLYGTEKVSTNCGTSFIIDVKSRWWCTNIQPSCCSLLLSHQFMLILIKFHPLLFGVHSCLCNKGSVFYCYGVWFILAASSSMAISNYTSPSVPYSESSGISTSLATTSTSINFSNYIILTIMIESFHGVVLW